MFAALKREWWEEGDESVKLVELKQLKQNSQTINKFVQILKTAAKRSGYKKRALVEKFKREINSSIRYKLMKAEWSPLYIDK